MKRLFNLSFQFLRVYILALILFTCAANIPNVEATNNDITVDDFRSHIGYLASDGLKGRMAGTKGDKLAKDYIVNHFTNAGLPAKRFVEVQEHYVRPSRMSKQKVLTYNIIATLPGNDPILKDEYVVIGGHYDSTKNPVLPINQVIREKIGVMFGNPESTSKDTIFDRIDRINNGADDNASGTAMTLELFEKYASLNNHKRTLVFILFGGEELGLLGSKYYTDNPTIQLDKVQLMVNLDMIGRLDDEKNVYLGGVPTAKDLDKIIDSFSSVDSSLNVISYNHSVSGVRSLFSRSDHYNFYKNDIPSLFFFTGIHPDYHTPRDEIDKVNFDGLKLISNLVDTVVGEAANRSEKFEFKPLPAEENEQPPMKMEVTLGVMPDYAHDGKGLKIDSVIAKKPAKKAGMIDGDIVLKIQDTDIDDIYKYMEALSKLKPGSKAKVIVLRNDKEIVLDVQF